MTDGTGRVWRGPPGENNAGTLLQTRYVRGGHVHAAKRSRRAGSLRLDEERSDGRRIAGIG